MTVRQAGAPVTDKNLRSAAMFGGMKKMQELSSPANKAGPISLRDAKCRLYPKLSFFFDGTGNNLDIDEPLQRLSNVAKLSRAAVDDPKGRGASVIYIPGVGTPFKVPKLVGYTDKLSDDKGGALGLGLGSGGEMRLQYALAEFSRTLELDWGSASWRCMQFIDVSIFGFSRGATEARAFVRRLIEKKCQRTDSGLIWQASNGERTPVRIRFMGLFDTVASVGGPTLHLDWGRELAIPTEVERCVHFVSAHEVREAFPLDSVRVGRDYPANCEEVVYP
ncbi:T6SS phospholipase effector Tle1-like catalytic domain-containing protein, partial [Paraburkholderia heleia]|uniref:T6SS phospholipase effector Tle1-like catalytic domain-containing protein n=1 Tax=Paraburkholderia heleia TaxID=634127 RepID=UPI0005A8236C